TDSTVNTEFDKESVLRRIREAKLEIGSSDLFTSVVASLREGLVILENPTVKEIICFGLGRIGECMISRYQFAFLLCLKDHYNVGRIKVYDPVFTETDRSILESFQCDILKENFEGKYRVPDKTTTIFYMPHCPKQLSNNLLWANWGVNLNYCILIANSFNTIVDNTIRRILNKNASYILNIIPHVVELAVINTFKFYEIFNDTAIHIFPWNKLKLLSDDFWSLNSEPNYSDEDIRDGRARMVSKVNTLRQIISELRCALPENSLKNNLALQYILSQYRKYKTTSEQLCKAREEVEFVANTYLCYLKSSRLHQEIHAEFHGKGERSVRETANLVGFKLPHDPK
ncbi:SRR1-like protein, partial [Asbolus verrucosus]